MTAIVRHPFTIRKNPGSLCYNFMAKKLVINRLALRSMFISMAGKIEEKST